MTLDISTLSSADLIALLATKRKEEKAALDSLAALPRFAFILVMADSSLIYWQGVAADADAAQVLAVAYATKDGGEIFDYCNRPLPNPKGRKKGSNVAKVDSTPADDTQTDDTQTDDTQTDDTQTDDKPES